MLDFLKPNHIAQLRVPHDVRLHPVAHKRPLLIRIRVSDQVSFGPLRTQKADSERDIRRHRVQIPPRVLHHRLVRGEEAHGHRNHGGSDNGGDAGGVRCGQDEGVEGVILQRAEDAAGAAEVKVFLVGGPELGGGVVEAEGESRVPDGGVAVRPVFLGESVGEFGDVGEGMNVVGVGGELVEVLLEIDDEVGVEHDGGGVALPEVGVGGEVGVVNDGSAGGFEDVDRVGKGGEDGAGSVAGGNDVAGNANAFTVEGREFAGGYVVRETVKRDGRRVVVCSVFSGNRLEKVGCIFDGTGHWSNSVLVLTNGDDETTRSKAYCGFDPYKVIDIARTEDAATRLEEISKRQDKRD